MSYSATAFEVMIASPSDVPQERVIARDVITEWNVVHAKDKQIVLMPVGWETHATPDTGDRPQAIINGQLLKEADLLVAVFWTRLGSPTGAAPSGTVEEIEEHIKAGKPAMIYFSSAPAHPDSIDADQYAALKEFKASLAGRGLYWEYESLSDFRNKFDRHLAKTIISKFGRSSSVSHTVGRSESTSSGDSASETEGDSSKATGVNWGTSRSQTAGVKSSQLPELSSPARELLIESSKDGQGVIMSLQTMEGASVQTNGRNFAERGNPRSEAQWRGAVEELHRNRLVEDRGGKREVYFINDEGYRVAERLKQQ